jgi:CheY-like chemotaxis protein
MDMKMPIMGGLEAIEIIKSSFPKIPSIAQTAFTQSEERESILKAGADAYLSKPIMSEDLITTILKLCIN